MLKERRMLWHPESPGSRVPVFVYLWSRRRFATIHQVLRYYRALKLVQPTQWSWPLISAPCDHCLCMEPEDYELSDRTVPHLKCCHCRKLYAKVPQWGL